MTATDELRRLLDERGVEWMDDSYAQLWCTVWHGQDGKQWRMTENQSGMLTELKAWKATPAQAIAATLGPTDPSERGLIPHFWTSDWTLHVETERLPERIDVTLPDQRGREVYSARVHRFVPERTCHNTQFAEMDEKAGKKYSMVMTALRFGGFMPEDEPAEFTCSACGKTALIDWETLYDIRFCPFCGARIVEVKS